MERSFESTAIAIGTGAGDPSDELKVADRAFGTVQFPAAMTGTKLVIEGSNDNGTTWGAIVDDDNVQLEITKSDDDIKRIPSGAFGVALMRFKSDATELAERTFLVHLES